MVGQFFGSIHDMGHSAMIQQLSLVLTAMLIAEIESFYDEIYVRIAMALHCSLQDRLFASVALQVVLHNF